MNRKMIKVLLGLLFTALLYLTVFFDSKPSFTQTSPVLYATQNRDDLSQLIHEAIMRAKKSIFLVIFSLKDDGIIQALESQAILGIDVTVIYDPEFGLKKKLNSKIHSIAKTTQGLMHRKILIIDDEEVWLGSSNFTTHSLRMHDNLVLALHSPLIAKTIIAHESLNLPLIQHRFTVGGQNLELWLLPEDRDGEERLVQLIESAKKTIKVAMFTWTNPRLTDAIIKAKNRGVSIDIVVERTSSKVDDLLKKFKKSGVFCRPSKKQVLLHHKFAYIDGENLVLGSANWTRSAFNKNHDCFIILHDLNETQKNYMDTLWDKIDKEAA